MDIKILPRKLKGTVNAIASKSQAHRLLICSAFADQKTELICPETNQDIEATVNCLRSLGTSIVRDHDRYIIEPSTTMPKTAELNCGESGSTLRFILPIVGALGVDATLHMSGRLPERPLSPLWEEMERMGCRLTRPTADSVRCQGRLQCGQYRIAGNVSSQFISGLLFSTALLDSPSTVEIIGQIESQPYIQLTIDALQRFGVRVNNFTVFPRKPFQSPQKVTVEGDWSNAAFFVAANALSNYITITGLNFHSAQGDRAVTALIQQMECGFTVIDATNIPDLIPILATIAGQLHGAEFINIERLRLKESDRVETVAEMLVRLGATVDISKNSMTVYPAVYQGCTINAHADHRIAMSAAIAATSASGPITLLGAQCVAKSYPAFWDDYVTLGGAYEQYIR